MPREFKVGGVAVEVLSDWVGFDAINARSSFDMTISDLLTAPSVDNGDSVQVFNNSIKIFEGIVNTIEVYEGSPGKLYRTVNVKDNSAIADKRLVVDVIENQTAGYIVTNHILNILSEEGITAGDIQDGPLIDRAVFNRIKCSQALDQLKTLAGFNWNIDKDKKLNFFDNATNGSPLVLDNTLQHYGFRQSKSLNQYRNRQYIRGGKGTTATQTAEKPTPEPDGVSRKFILRFPVAEKPRIFIDSVEVDPADIGINGVDEGKRWYYNKDKEFVVQDNSETVLTSANVLEVDYKGFYNLLGYSENPAQISERASVEEGTSGIYESLTKEPSIDSSEGASQFADGLLSKYGEVEDKVTFVTEVDGFEAGQLLTVQKQLYGINTSFLIESVSIIPIGDKIEYTVTALDGAALGGWEEFFKDLIASGGQFNINENEVVILLNTTTETDNNQGELTIQLVDPLIIGDDVIISDSLTIGTITNEVILND